MGPLLRAPAVAVALSAAALLLLGSSPYARKPSLSTLGARSFVITDAETLAPFTFERVMESLSAGRSAAWLETLVAPQNSGRQPVVMPLSGFIVAPQDGHWRPAGARWSHVRPIAIVNRFDLAPADYRHCGEYRLILTRRTDGLARLHIAVEGVLPNPHPDQGKAGCAAIAAFWWDLAGIGPASARGERLERFFFDGGVLERDHFARNAGRIRTSEIGAGRPRFRQFELVRVCASTHICIRELTRVPLDNTPDGALFDAGLAGDRGASFRREFLRQVASLSIRDANRYSMTIDRTFSASNVETFVPVFNYRLPFLRSQRTAAGREFRARIAEELRKTSTGLTPEDVIARAETQNCMGCHGKSGPVGDGVVFPKAFEQGEQIADESMAKSPRLSPALEEVFVPYRIEVLREYLRTVSSTAPRNAVTTGETQNESMDGGSRGIPFMERPCRRPRRSRRNRSPGPSGPRRSGTSRFVSLAHRPGAAGSAGTDLGNAVADQIRALGI
ncbi:MAG TPA: hypothetical protein VEO54_29825 [Thermoanaerobaculia bacterium]|nr:hypothetical protein [Thermoanaerobaculia bacterium]